MTQYGAIFDMDGLLIDSERLYQRVWREMAAEVGVTLDESFSYAICGIGEKLAEEVIRRYIPGPEPYGFIQECKRRVTELEKIHVPVKPGAQTILAGMRRAGFRIAVASSSPMEMIRHNLTATGLLEYFDELVCGADAARGKPFPDIFLLAAERLGLEPGVCWIFEDSINGVKAAHAAGGRAVMIPDIVPPSDEVRPLAAIYPDLAVAWEEIQRGL